MAGHRHHKKGIDTRTHTSWRMMIERCSRPKKDGYHNYGERGITVCDRWLGADGYENFLADLGERPEGKTLGRYGDVGNYEPSNVAWMTNEEQGAEQRKKTAAKKLDKTPVTV